MELHQWTPQQVAQSLRGHWMMPRGPVENLTALAERAGVVVTQLNFSTPLLDALSFRLPGLPPLIFMNSVVPGDRYAPGCFTAVRLLALTGMRLGEVLGLRWLQIDFEAGCARLADAKAGARVVPLGAPVLAYLADLPRGGDYLCEAIDPTKPLHLKTFRRFWTRLRDRSGIKNARPHDFRHTAGTYTAQSGANAFVVCDVLGHKSLAMSGRHVGRSVDPLRTATDHFSNRVAAAMGGKPSADVVDLNPGKG